MYDQFYDVTVG